MSESWIKIEKCTPDKPEIFEMGEILGVDPDAVLGKLIRAWAWMDSNSEDGHIKNVTGVLLDRIVMLPGFSDALKKVGWLTESDIPNFDRHLGKNAKKRAKDAERKRKSRLAAKESPTLIGTKPAIDKIREDKSKDSNSSSETTNEGKKTTKNKFTSDDLRVAEQMYTDLILFNPGHKKPNLESWASDIRKMREIDLRLSTDIWHIWSWARKDSFWQKNILSPSKLREKFDQLVIKQKETPYANGSNQQHSNQSGLINRVQKKAEQSIARINEREARENNDRSLGKDDSVVSTQVDLNV